MKIVQQRVECLAHSPMPLENIERAGRTCYKSEDKITPYSAKEFVCMIIKRGHDSVLEHANVTFRITTDRGISHEIVRHRIGMSYSQESTRYVKYGDIEVIAPSMPEPALTCWRMAMEAAETAYRNLIDLGMTPQWARSVLPNSLKTEIVVTGNFRAWRHFLKLRLSSAAHPQIREIAAMIKDWFVRNELSCIVEGIV